MEPTKEKIVRAARMLRGVCDGARVLDGAGYNKLDAPLMHDLVDRGGPYTDKQIRLMWHVIRKYKGQLQSCGIVYEELVPPPAPPKPDPKFIAVAFSWEDTRYGRRVALRFPFNRTLVDACRSLEKRWWDPKLTAWLTPDDLDSFDSAVGAVEAAQAELSIPDAMREHYESMRAARAEGLKASRAMAADLKIETKLRLLPFQQAGVAYIESKGGRALVSDDMGLGKTAQAIGYLIRHPEAFPALVVCPATLRVNWVREIEKFSDLKAMVIATKTSVKQLLKVGVPAHYGMWPGHQVFVINYDILNKHPWIWEAGFKTLILDEAHYAKEQDSNRTKHCMSLAAKIPNVILLTGTPLLNRPKELWTLTQMVDPKLFPNFFRFGKEYCNAHQKTVIVAPRRDKKTGKLIPGGPREVWDFNGASNLDRLDRVLRERIMVRREKSEVLPELPEKRRVTVPLAMNGHLSEYQDGARPILERIREMKKQRDEWKKKLAKMDEEARKKYLAEHAEEASAMGKIAGVMVSEIAALRTRAAEAKLEDALERIISMQEEAGKIIVFAHHHTILDRLSDALRENGLKVVQVDGREDASKRQEAIDAFQGGDAQVAVLGIMAASVGLTLTAASNVVFVELPWRPGDVEQAEARVWRYGQRNSVTSWFLVALGTIEESMAKMLDTKREVVNAAVGEGDRTLEEEGILDAILDEVIK